MRGIDHLVLPVTTLTLARSRLTALGFTVAPDARHPFGTGNCCVFFADRSYLEPITLVDRSAADMAAAEGQFFIRRVKRFMQRQGEGFAMLALKSEDADADHAAFERAGVSAGPKFEFRRNAAMPAGGEREIGVKLAYAHFSASPDAAFFACQHLAADALFQAEYLQHPNGAAGISAVTAVADEPAAFRGYLAAATGGAEAEDTSGGFEAASGAQRVAILTRAAFRVRYGVDAPDPRRGLLFAGFDVQVADPERTVGFAGPTAVRHEGRVVVPPAPGLGATLAFHGNSDDQAE
jgi:hypothetical protein